MFLKLATPEQMEKIRKTCNEDVNSRSRDLETIKEWLRKQPHLPDNCDKNIIMGYLRGCNFSLEKTKKKLDAYFTLKGAVPECCSNRDITRPELQEIMKLANLAVLPNLTPDGERLVVVGAVSTDFEMPDFADFLKILSMINDLRLKINHGRVSGEVYIVDAAVALFKYFTKISPTIIKKFFVYLRLAHPFKVKKVHVINPSNFVDFLIKWVSPFLNDKMRSRIHVHANIETLYEYVPKDMLPEEFGGTAGKVQKYQKEMEKALEEYGSWFREQENVKADESKRPGKPTSHEELFGLDGSFKQLTID